MSDITVANGWQHILQEAVEEASKLPEEWCFEIVSADRVDGPVRLRRYPAGRPPAAGSQAPASMEGDDADPG